MFDISIIIFLLALLGIAAMFLSQSKKLKRGELGSAFASKDLSYENFKILNEKTKVLWLQFIHAAAIILSKLWARLTHHIVSWFHRGVKRVEDQLIKHEKKHGTDDITKKSVFLTTIKTYKSEIKKLKGKVEEELPRPRIVDEPKNVVDIRPDINTIDESKLPE
jgi:hypothetical protein